MSLRPTLTETKQLEKGIWLTRLNSADRRALGVGEAGDSGPTVILVKEANFNPTKSQLDFSISQLDILTSGFTDSVIVIAKESGDEPYRAKNLAGPLISVKVNADSAHECGTMKQFLEDCRKYLIPNEVIIAVEEILYKAAQKIQFDLHEGETKRKWTSAPNFIALTIQNRNRQLLVSVKGNPSKMDYRKIRPKVSRPPYCEFHFYERSQAEEVTDIVMKSINY